jgi:hypothetical protein
MSKREPLLRATSPRHPVLTGHVPLALVQYHSNCPNTTRTEFVQPNFVETEAQVLTLAPLCGLMQQLETV